MQVLFSLKDNFSWINYSNDFIFAFSQTNSFKIIKFSSFGNSLIYDVIIEDYDIIYNAVMDKHYGNLYVYKDDDLLIKSVFLVYLNVNTLAFYKMNHSKRSHLISKVKHGNFEFFTLLE